MFDSDFLSLALSSEVNKENYGDHAPNSQQNNEHNDDDCCDLKTSFLETVRRLSNALFSKFIAALCGTLTALATILPPVL